SQPGSLAAPERRARREGEQRRKMREQAVDDADRLLGIVDGDVDVHPEDELAPSDVLHLVDERVVPVLRRDPLTLEEAERMRARRADARPALGRDLRDVCTEACQPAHDVARVPADRRRDLDDGLHELRVDASLELVPAHCGEHRVDVLDEVERLRVEELVLLLHAERVRIAAPEGVVEHAATTPFAGDRGRERLLAAVPLGHGSTAATWISTFQRGSKRPARTVVFAGRTSPKTSACARAKPSKSVASVRYTRVRTTLSRLVPACESAVPISSRH